MSRSRRNLRCGACPNRGDYGIGPALGCQACVGWQGQRALLPSAGRRASDALTRRSGRLWMTVGPRWRCRQASRASSLTGGRTDSSPDENLQKVFSRGCFVGTCVCLSTRFKSANTRTHGGRAERQRGLRSHLTFHHKHSHTRIRQFVGQPARSTSLVMPPRPPRLTEHPAHQGASLPTTESCRHGHAPGWRWPRRAAPWRAAPQPRRTARQPPAAAAEAEPGGARPPAPSHRRG